MGVSLRHQALASACKHCQAGVRSLSGSAALPGGPLARAYMHDSIGARSWGPHLAKHMCGSDGLLQFWGTCLARGVN